MPKSNHINFKKKYLIRRASKLNFSGDYHHDALLLPIDSNLLPKDLLTLGHISGAVGIKGDLKFILKKPLKYNLRLASFESMLKTLKKFWLVGDSSYLFTINFVINNDRFFKLNFEEIKTRSNAENFVG